tara:strand:- start:805 stop:1149 length:345 start_codon:yes stop_codon:yes gene_type:complete
MALIKVISEDMAEAIYDVNIPVVVSNVGTTGVSYAITTATTGLGPGFPKLDITIPEGDVTMTGAAYIQNMNELIEAAVADPYAIPTFTQTYKDTDAYLAPVEYHAILTQTVSDS